MNEEIDVEKKLVEILQQSLSAPFLFIGSGFSRRYIELPDWSGLLEHFCKYVNKPFQQYLSSSNGNYPEATSLLAKDFSETWWEEHNTCKEIFSTSEWRSHVDTPLKYEISKYLKEFQVKDIIQNNKELEVLKNKEVVIDGIITTNWDLLLETLFPKLKVYIGQSDLFFKAPQSIGEIYKIHGCCSNYNSLIVTQDDYSNFNKKNAYLAAKLLSIFLEHPVIFIGYSISDLNIQELLEQIINMIEVENHDYKERLSKNLIFITRAKDNYDNIQTVAKKINDRDLNFTNIETNDFSKIYKALQHIERKIPIDYLRVIKEGIYNIVKDPSNSNKKLAVIDFEEAIKDSSKIEFVVGIGVTNSIGLKGFSINDIIKDIIFNNIHAKSYDLLMVTIPELAKRNRVYLPMQKYIASNQGKKIPSSLNEINKLNTNEYIKKISSSIKKNYKKTWKLDSIIHLSENSCKIDKKLNYLAIYLSKNKTEENCDNIISYIQQNFENLKQKLGKNNSALKRLICIIDQVKYRELL